MSADIRSLELLSRLARVRLLGLDVDGVLTDGGLFYTESGEELKRFHVKDGQGLKLLMASGVEVAIISASRSQSTVHRARVLGIRHVFLGVEDKLTALVALCSVLDLSLDQVAYAGDDLNDLPVLRAVGVPLSVADGMPENRAAAVYVTSLNGGNGAVRELCDLICQARREQRAYE